VNFEHVDAELGLMITEVTSKRPVFQVWSGVKPLVIELDIPDPKSVHFFRKKEDKKLYNKLIAVIEDHLKCSIGEFTNGEYFYVDVD